MNTIDREAARYLLDVADAISAVTSGATSYGSFYVVEVKIGFDGETTDFRVVPNEHGDYDLALVKP